MVSEIFYLSLEAHEVNPRNPISTEIISKKLGVVEQLGKFQAILISLNK